ncbi:L-serine ammonia-lyase [Gluconacetobacter azotocaptans]|uniref:L-serine dehydratase n=1 Tax=Gluconacetobacter azotocaptans TaxID=142834 RepID=A0A7W4JQA4_9PROT|nr:L-serine ammonia-lyase [Gluconacetobacter azotocaptans]MBB2188964.1 L-serine ammonia-lyase [Gluconacetobacter azotocaptans]GBQ25890.1 L-serine deaminase [Gluconacetobacter azotocaptans DSM 13594]
MLHFERPVRTGLSDLFRIGIGPSSSHTVGPMIAAARFVKELPCDFIPAGIRVRLMGSLALTGQGHATGRAVLLGLMGHLPDTVDPDCVPQLCAHVAETHELGLPGGHRIPFDPRIDIVADLDGECPLHPNTLVFEAWGDCRTIRRTYCSIGGGTVIEAGQPAAGAPAAVPYPFGTATALLEMGHRHGLTIAQIQMANECADASPAAIQQVLDTIWTTMKACVARGLTSQEIELPGGLRVRRRAAQLHARLVQRSLPNVPDGLGGMEWINLYALSVSEENAAGGRVVTAPTNGAAGIVPAVLHYYQHFVPDASDAGVGVFLLTAAAIGTIIKTNASISGAEVGCQGEVGSACAMAAAGFAAVLGGSNAQIENAAEIALEHHLGLTCDPVAGLVQIPCIERNALAAVKAVNAARLALCGDGAHRVSLDDAIRTMRDTGRDMMSKYKETSLGGLAVNVTAC